MTDTPEVPGILDVLSVAGVQEVPGQVRKGLFQVHYSLAHQREIHVRLSDISKGDAHERGDVVSKLLGEHISIWTMRLVRRVVGCSDHGRPLHNLRRYAQWAATIQNRLFVIVATAILTSEAQVERLRSILSKHYGTNVDPMISIDPEVVDNFRLRAGMIAIDVSLVSRISTVRDTIASQYFSYTH